LPNWMSDHAKVKSDIAQVAIAQVDIELVVENIAQMDIAQVACDRGGQIYSALIASIPTLEW